MGMSKGVFGSFTDIMVIAIVLVMGAGGGLIVFSSGLEQTLSLNMNDLNGISEASTYGDYYETIYLPEVLNLSEQRAAYTLASQQGGIPWSRNTVPYTEVKSKLGDKLENAMTPIFESYIEESDEVIRCSVESDYSIDVRPGKNVISGQKPSISCSPTESITAVYGMKKRIVELHPTTFLKLGKDMNSLLETTEKKLPSSKKTDTGDASICSSTVSNPNRWVKAAARQNSYNNVVDSLESVPENAVSETDLNNGFSVEEKPISFSPGSSSADIIEGPKTTGNCDCTDENEDGTFQDSECDGDTYYAKAEYTLDSIAVEYDLKDTRSKILMEKGPKYLVFSASYNHPLD